jgi:hypothetical protein
MPFGGVKASGHGRFGESWASSIVLSHAVPSPKPRSKLVLTRHTGGPEGLRSLCHVKAITEDRLFSLIRTPIPGAVGASVLRFPRLPRWSSSQLVHQCYCRTPAHAGHRFPLTARLDLVGVPPRSRAARIRPEVVVQALGSRRGVAERLGVTVSTSAAQGGFDFTARRPGRVAVGHCIGALYMGWDTKS